MASYNFVIQSSINLAAAYREARYPHKFANVKREEIASVTTEKLFNVFLHN